MDDLPQGLVSTTGKVSSELDDMNAVDVKDIAQLWKVYSANPSVHEGDIGYRLENFFWRIWSSEHLRSSIDGSTLARLFLRISEPSPFSIAPMQQMKKKAASQDTKQSDEKQQEKSNGPNPLPPILKKPSAGESQRESQKTTRLLLTGIGGQSITRKPSTPPTPVPPPQKRAYIVASKAKGAKRRPVVMRRKSSQTPSGTNTRANSPPRTPVAQTMPPEAKPSEAKPSEAKPSEQVDSSSGSEETDEEGGEEQTEPDKPTELPPALLSLKEILTDKKSPPRSAKPTPPKWGFISSDDFTHYDVRFLSAENYEQPSSASLVDKDFRTRFVERQRQEYEQYLASSLGAAAAASAITEEGFAQFMDAKSIDPASPKTTSNVDPSNASSGISILTPTHDSSAPLSIRRRSSGFSTMQTPKSLSRGPSQLSLLIEESRKKATDNKPDSTSTSSKQVA